MKAVAEMSPIEIVAHRVIWSIPVAGVVLLLLGRTGDLKVAFRSPRTLALAALTAGLIGINWSTYVYAIVINHAVDAALGYYINPLLNVVLGAVFLGERFTREADRRRRACGRRRRDPDRGARRPAVDLAGAGDRLRLLRHPAQDSAHRSRPGLHARGPAALAGGRSRSSSISRRRGRGISASRAATSAATPCS